ncbi:MAG: ABC transporter ATP-binding protein [Candidatus Helarchaeota archaeon]
MVQTEFIEKVVFGGEEIKDAIKWSRKRAGKILKAEIKGIEPRSRKQFRGTGIIVDIQSRIRRKFIAILLEDGFLGSQKLASNLVLTIGGNRNFQEDIAANLIILKNTLRKNIGNLWFFDGQWMGQAVSWLSKALKTARVIAYIRGWWVDTGEPLYVKGEVFSSRKFMSGLRLRQFFVMEILVGKVGAHDMANLAVSVGGKSIFPFTRWIYREDLMADKILFKLGQKSVEKIRYDYILDVKGLTVSYGRKKKPVLQNASFKIRDGEILGIVGESGSGKSTTLKAILGDISYSKGTIRLCGIDSEDRHQISPRIGYVPQDLSRMYLEFTPLENILYFGQQYGIRPEELIRRGKQVLRDLGIVTKANTPVNELSGGEQRRVSIAISLIHYPKIMFLDEPTSGLDPVRRHELWDYLDSINREYGISLVVVTHFPNEAEYCDKVAIFLKNKGFIDFGSPNELKGRLPGSGYALEITLEIFDPEVIQILEKLEKVSFVLQRGESIRIFSEADTKTILNDVLKAITDTTLKIHRIEPKIEIDMIDLFLYYSKFGTLTTSKS